MNWSGAPLNSPAGSTRLACARRKPSESLRAGDPTIEVNLSDKCDPKCPKLLQVNCNAHLVSIRDSGMNLKAHLQNSMWCTLGHSFYHSYQVHSAYLANYVKLSELSELRNWVMNITWPWHLHASRVQQLPDLMKASRTSCRTSQAAQVAASTMNICEIC